MAITQLLMCLCLVLFLSDAGLAQDPTLIVQFRLGLSFVPSQGIAQIDCAIDNLDQTDVFAADPIQWFHNGSRIQDSARITIDDTIPDPFPSQVISKLEIDDLILTDAGEYECRVLFNTPPDLQLEGSVVLRVAIPVTVNAEPEQEAIEGESAELLCTATSSPPPTITWFRIEENGNETELLEQETGDPNFGNLTFPNVDRNQAGQYKCEGGYIFGVEFVLINLIVLTAPEITNVTLAEPEFLKGDTISVDCDAEGVRAPMYSWIFEEEELQSDNRTTINNQTGMLIIEDATFQDVGSYKCVVTNEVGNDTREVFILVVGSPEILHPFNRTVDVIVGIGTTAELICPYLAYPQPTVLWYAMDDQGMFQQLGEGTDERYSFDTTAENATLTIENVQNDDATTYLCNVTNEYGSDTRELELIVIGVSLVDPTSFTVSEEDSEEFCVQIDRVLEQDIPLSLSFGGTAGSGDYQTNPTLIIPSLTAVGNSVCHQITIIDDDIVEDNETLTIAIRVANSNDVINGGDVTVTILDNDGVSVSLVEPTSFTVTEEDSGSNTDEEFCVQLDDDEGGLERDIPLSLSFGGSAGSGDYQTNPTLTIPSSTAVGNSVCHQITIIDDDIVEGDESFTITLSLANSNDVITGSDVVTVTILDNEVVDCGTLMDPKNGQVNFTGTTLGADATYTCDEGLALEGVDTRTCEADGEWSDSEPTCGAEIAQISLLVMILLVTMGLAIVGF